MGWLRWLMVHLSQETGTSNASSRAYDFWSGFAGDIPLVGVFAVAWHHLNCKTPGCRRIGKAHLDHQCGKCAKAET